MEIVKIKSLLPFTDYAPSWNFSLGFEQWADVEKVNKIKIFLLTKEQEIIKAYQTNNDGGTGLGLNSVTSRFGNYNLFDFISECPELKDLLNFFRTSYLKFVVEDRTDIKILNIVCWYNVVRKSQKISIHNHSSANDAYLSGNMHLNDYDTKTIYKNPYDFSLDYAFENKIGNLTIFPSCLPHYTSMYVDDDTRVSIAFDLHLELGEPNTIDKTFVNPNRFGSREYASWQKQKSLRAIPFMYPEIFAEISLKEFPNGLSSR